MVRDLSYATIHHVVDSWERMKRSCGASDKRYAEFAGGILFRR